MSDLDNKYQRVKDLQTELLKAAQELHDAASDEAVILKGAARNAISVVRGLPGLLEHAMTEQTRNDALLAKQTTVNVVPPVAPPPPGVPASAPPVAAAPGPPIASTPPAPAPLTEPK